MNTLSQQLAIGTYCRLVPHRMKKILITLSQVQGKREWSNVCKWNDQVKEMSLKSNQQDFNSEQDL